MQHVKNHIVLFDGVCNLCNASVQFILQHDRRKTIRFAALQWPLGQEILQNHHLDTQQFDSIVYYRKGKLWQESSAVLYICRDMGGWWPCLFPLVIVPPFIRDRLYRLIAKNRYAWFGKKNACMRPTADYQTRFITS